MADPSSPENAPATAPQVTLLLAHGVGFCKEIWDPIIRRLREAPLLRDTPTEILAIDLPFHGSKRDESVAPQIKPLSPTSVRVEHPASDWITWAPNEVYEQVEALRRRQDANKQKRTAVIGIGHSMGAASLWQTEATHPGTFDGLLLFEPTYGPNDAATSLKADFLISVVLKREASWPSRDAAVAYFESYRNFAAWDRESLAGYLKGTLVPERNGSEITVLATHPHIEAAMYSGIPVFFPEAHDMEKPKCSIVWLSGSRSRLFATEYFEPMAKEFPQIYRIAAPIPNLSHLMVLESPSESTAKILEELAQMPAYHWNCWVVVTALLALTNGSILKLETVKATNPICVGLEALVQMAHSQCSSRCDPTFSCKSVSAVWNSDVLLMLTTFRTYTTLYMRSQAENISMSSTSDKAGATLLFAHGGGFCKEIWDPITRRLQASPLLKQQNAATRIVMFDFPYHGTKRDESVPAKVNMETPTSPRVIHSGNQWIQWSTEEVYRQVQAIHASAGDGKRAPLIGIGHSMGAVALWNTEVTHPGTFDGLILFEPVYSWDEQEESKSIDFLVSITLNRESKWLSRDAAAAHFDALRNFASWDRESLKSYLQGAVVDNNDGSNLVSLACHPLIECSLYSGRMLSLTDDQLARPKCRAVFQSGERTQLFKHDLFCSLAETYSGIYKVAPPMPKTSHLMVLEDPAEAARRILESLTEFAPFQAQSSQSPHSRL
ncbi:Serine protease family s33, partial [Globisporangium splendens]